MNDTKIYHGSQQKLDKLAPQNFHGDPDIDKAIFATPSKSMATAYLGRWTDRDIAQGGASKDEHTLEEMRPGAFNDVFKGKKGYLYSLLADKFKNMPGRHKSELISTEEVVPENVEEIKDILRALKDQGTVMKRYNPKGASYAEQVKIKADRASGMKDGGKGYLNWLSEGNPELAKAVTNAMSKTAEEYSAPYPMDKLPAHLKKDPVHKWRAESGIELLHQEPSIEEMTRIIKNWKLMSKEQKALSDAKSLEMYGQGNKERIKELLGKYAMNKSAEESTIIDKASLSYYIKQLN